MVFCLVGLPVQARYGSVKQVRSISSNQEDDIDVTGIRDLSGTGRDKSKGKTTPQSYDGQYSKDNLYGINLINVHVLGDVEMPGVYKINISDRAADVVKRAGIKRSTVRVIQVRHPGEKIRYYDLYQYYFFGNLRHNPFLKANDVIFVPKHKGAIRIEGSVMRPGVYELFGEKTLYQIIKLAGGFSHGVSKMYPVKIIRYSDGGEKFVLTAVQNKSTLKRFNIIKGDIVIVPDIINAAAKFDYTIETIPGEQHVYPTAIPEVFVIGTVNEPGPYPYKSHLTVKDYLGFAGASAEANFSYVKVLREGKRKRKKLYDKVQAGDVIIVKEKSLNVFMKYIGIATTLMSVTLSVIVLKDVLKKQ